MRLLNVHKLRFETHKHPPPYAILSHTWREAEATYRDIVDLHKSSDHWVQLRKLSHVSGFAKIDGFARYVQRHYPAINLVWIDSCCINKDSESEESEAVNSMFKWYSNAHVCITYLSDLDNLDLFESCRWFERGWTLQELLASDNMVFVDKSWQAVGCKGHIKVGVDLEARVARRTGIPRYLLADFTTNRGDVTTSLTSKWMEGRETERDEDMVYSLFGILGIVPGSRYGEGVEEANQRLLDAVKNREHRKMEGQRVFREIIDWIGCPDSSTHHTAARSLHQQDTGLWLLNSDKYKSWLRGDIRHLWLHGKPGCGKTILCSTVIEDVKKHYESAAYFYISLFDKDKQSYTDLLKSLIEQWAWREPAATLLRRIWELPVRKALTTSQLEEVVIAAAPPRALLIIDALDECAVEQERQDLLEHLEDLVRATKVQLFVTSRHLLDIRETMHIIEADQLSIEPSHVQEDIHTYVSSQLASKPGLRSFAPEIKSTIEKSISGNAKGMFKWAVLLMDELRSLQRSNKTIIDETLKHFPHNLDAVYGRGLIGIKGDDARREALILLQWLAYAQEPLTIEQLLDALVISPVENTVRVNDRSSAENIFRLLSSLIDVVPGSDEIGPETKITLAHASVREYLESKKAGFFQINHKRGHHLLEQSCITYILWSAGRAKPLLPYAIKSWYFHNKEMQPIDRAELEGNEDSTAKMLETADLRGNAGEMCGDPVQAAASRGDANLVQLLLSLGADVNTRGGHYGRALQAASDEGHLDIVRLLVEHGANINADGGFFGRALGAAASKNFLDIVQFLLDNGAEINGQGSDQGTALQCAADAGRIEAVRLLLSKGANVNMQGGRFGNPLQAAAAKGRIEVVRELLAAGANTDAYSGCHQTALHATACEDRVEIARMLIEKTNIETLDAHKRTALHIAASTGHAGVGEVLLKAGAQTETCCSVEYEACTALYVAATRGYYKMVRLLIDAGADLNATNDSGFTPINSASYHGKIDVVKLLLDAGADITLANNRDWTPLMSAKNQQQHEIVSMLLDRGDRRDSRSSAA